jgi:hypothetical protein
MLKSLSLEKFTVFPKTQFSFARHLNVFIGENGTGKTHILKAAYSGIAVSAAWKREKIEQASFAIALADKLQGVFQPRSLGRLVRRAKGRGKCKVELYFEHSASDLAFSVTTLNATTLLRCPSTKVELQPVFIPTRELLTIAPGFVSLFETTHLPFEETWRDTCILLQAPLARGPKQTAIRRALEPIEAAMGGTVGVDSAGRFYLDLPSGGMEMHLVAEGLRKLAMIARLVATGSLLNQGFLFWDEPESNLNPKLIKTMASTIVQLASGGVQVFLGTHSLFLMRELDLLTRGKSNNFESRYFGLHADAQGAVNVMASDSIDGVGDITSLEEELAQADRYLEAQ